jgi:transposase
MGGTLESAMSNMETMERKKPRPRRSFTPEAKAKSVELCRRCDRNIGQMARDKQQTEGLPASDIRIIGR